MAKPLPSPERTSYPSSVDRDGINVHEFAKDRPALVTHPTCCEHVDSETRIGPVEPDEWARGRSGWRP